MAHFIIHGGRALTGVYRTPGNKNAALPMLAASILTSEPVTLRNLPLIEDVFTMLSILEDLGVAVDLSGHTVTLCAKGLRKRRLNEVLCRNVRSSILFAGPMAARHGRVVISPPGGDVIGRRRLDTHFQGLRQLGIHVSGTRHYEFRRGRLCAAQIVLDEASVTATENILMAATLSPGTTTVFNAACEPHVQDLCRMLNKMGASIRSIGTNYLHIRGVDSLGGVRHRIAPDYIHAASFLAAAAATGGELRVENLPLPEFKILARPFRRLGISWAIQDGALSLPALPALRIRNDYGSAIPTLEDGPWPNFPSDLMSIAVVLASQAKGTMLFFEKMFESRMYFVDRLIEMGARLVQCDPHRVIVSGPARLHGARLSSPDIRAGIALLIAALCARGETVIANIESIDRGYERVATQFRKLGADIVRKE